MAAPSTVKVYNVLRQQDGTPLVNANVHLILDYNQATVTATGDDIIDLQQSATTDATGTYTFTVVPTDLMSPSNLTYTVVEPNRTYQIAPLSTGGASQQTTAVGVIVNQPGALAAATQNVTGPLTVQGALVAQSTFQAQGVTRLDADAQLHGPDPWFDVTHPSFGARGDGVTDDTAAIQAALTAANNAGGGVVWLPSRSTAPTVYRHTGNLKIGSNTTLQGAGTAAVILRMINGAGGDASIVNLTYRTFAQGQPDPNWTPRETGITIQDLTVDGNKANQGGNSFYGINLRPCSKVKVRRVRVINTGLQGVMIQHSTDVEVSANSASATSADAIMVSDCVRYVIANNIIEDSGDYGIEVGSGYMYGSPGSPADTVNGATDGVVVGNVVRNAVNYGICLRGIKSATSNPNNRPTRRTAVVGNSVTGCGVAGLGVQELTDEFTITGNSSCSNNNGGTGSGLAILAGNGQVATGNRGTVSGNTFNDNVQQGVTCVSCTDVTFSGNTVMNNAQNGITGSFTDCSFLGNKIRNNNTSAGTYDNLSLSATSQNCEIRGNDLKDHGARTARYDLNGNSQAGLAIIGNRIGVINGAATADSSVQTANLGGVAFTSAAAAAVTNITGLSVSRTPIVDERASLMLRVRCKGSGSTVVGAYIATSPAPVAGLASISSVMEDMTVNTNREIVVVGSVDLAAGTAYTFQAQFYQGSAGTYTADGLAQNTELVVITVPR